MRREDGYARRDDEPTRPVRVTRLRLRSVDDSGLVALDEPAPRPTREPTVKLVRTPTRW